MLGILVQAGTIGELDNFAEVHDRHPMADVLHNTQIMRDEKVSELELLLQIHQQVDDLGLDGNIERAHWLVANDELRLDGECSRNSHALTLPSAELVRVTIHDVLGRPTRSSSSSTRFSPSLPSFTKTMNHERLIENTPDRHSWI